MIFLVPEGLERSARTGVRAPFSSLLITARLTTCLAGYLKKRLALGALVTDNADLRGPSPPRFGISRQLSRHRRRGLGLETDQLLKLVEGLLSGVVLAYGQGYDWGYDWGHDWGHDWGYD